MNSERKLFSFKAWHQFTWAFKSKIEHMRLRLKQPNVVACPVALLKFGYSEKATKFEKIFHLKFDASQ